MYTLWSLLRKKRDSTRMITEKDEEVIVKKLLDRMKNKYNETSPPKTISHKNESKVCRFFRKGREQDTEVEVKSKGHCKRERFINDKNKSTTMNAMDSSETRMKKKIAETNKTKEEIEEHKKNKETKNLNDELHVKKDRLPNTMMVLENIENHIKLLELKIEVLLNALGVKEEKSSQKDSKGLLKSLNSIEERLKCLKEKTDVPSKSSMSNAPSMAEKLIGIEEFLNEISDNLEVTSKSNPDGKKIFEQSKLQNADSLISCLEDGVTSNETTNPFSEENDKECRGNNSSTNSDINLNKSEATKQDDEPFPKTVEKNFKEDLNKLLQKYFGDKLAHEDVNKNTDKIKYQEEESFEETEICEKNIKKVAQLKRELEMCVCEKTKIVNHYQNWHNDIRSDVNMYVDDGLDPYIMVEFKKDLKEFLKKYFGNALNSNDCNTRYASEIDTKHVFKKLPTTAENETISMENEIKEVIEKELSTDIYRVNINKTEGNKAESQTQDKLDSKLKRSIKGEQKSTSKLNNRSPMNGVPENAKHNRNDDTRIGKELGVKEEEEKSLLMNDLKAKLEKIFSSRAGEQNEIELQRNFKDEQERSSHVIQNPLKKELENELHGKFEDLKQESEKKTEGEQQISQEKQNENFQFNKDLKDSIKREIEELEYPVGGTLDGRRKEKSTQNTNLKRELDEQVNGGVPGNSKSEKEYLKEDLKLQKPYLETLDSNYGFKKELKGQVEEEFDREKNNIEEQQMSHENQGENSYIGKNLKDEVTKDVEDSIEKRFDSEQKEKFNVNLKREPEEQFNESVQGNSNSRTEHLKDNRKLHNTYMVTLDSNYHEPLDNDSRDEIKAVLMKELIKRIDDETMKFKNQLRIELLEKFVGYLTSETDKFEYNKKEYSINNIEKLIEDKFNKSKERLKLEFTEEIEKRFSSDSKESQNEIKTVIIEEIERKINTAKFDLEPPVKHKKSIKNLFKMLGKHLKKTKSKKELLSEIDYNDDSGPEEFEQGMKKAIMEDINEQINSDSNNPIESLENENNKESAKDLKTQFIYQLGITDTLKTKSNEEHCNKFKNTSARNRSPSITKQKRTVLTSTAKKRTHIRKLKVSTRKSIFGHSNRRDHNVQMHGTGVKIPKISKKT